ncbi:hypothetical protein [Hymenobacter terricola]|uniref:hypothetical protein n=1 Tax=Hymenobacter terricola TaxID=2819236 RepID=UPI001B30C82A|nr:hypothetical protein [Hymenobacter terricola]
MLDALRPRPESRLPHQFAGKPTSGRRQQVANRNEKVSAPDLYGRIVRDAK